MEVVIIENKFNPKDIKMEKAIFVDEVTVTDPDTLFKVEVTIFKHPNGGMFGMDCSYIDQCLGTDDDDVKIMLDPFVQVVDPNNVIYIELCD